ncbi:16766_t:CDS:2 [Dentiscutata erythropus]|uniref:16766_t:CDS:1 n=1 Tax=Dentiscutata erythropus TaxID=1348616 RepID=A0A9N9EUC2_9GLOM|nr:16766_t:CDS:2 [Dentiscutata erythropus]
MYPGQQYSQQNQQQGSQNNQFPGGFVLPSSDQQNYSPQGSYPTPPPGPPPSGGYAPPPGPPPGSYIPHSYTLQPRPPSGDYAPPGPPSGPPSGGYAPPPSGYTPPPGPPSSGYALPPGPPSGGSTPQPRPPSGGYTPPPGPPSSGYTPPPPGPPSSGYTPPPPGPPSGGYAPQPGPPSLQNQQHQNGYMGYRSGGRKKALLIGINYFNQQAELRGCLNDVANVKKFLIEVYGFQESNMVILTDDQKDPTRIPIKANILEAMKWLAQDAQPGDL